MNASDWLKHELDVLSAATGKETFEHVSFACTPWCPIIFTYNSDKIPPHSTYMYFRNIELISIKFQIQSLQFDFGQHVRFP